VDVLGVIPARGGSKAIPRKNLALLAGRPLLAHTADAARASTRLTRLVVSTDDEEIAGAARACGVEVPFLRPAALAQDDTPMLDVLLDLLATLAERSAYRPDVVVLLQPTSPFRRAEHIDAAIGLLVASGADSVVSVVPVPHQFTPASLLRLEGDRVIPADSAAPLRRQDKPMLYARNGPAVVAARSETLVGQHTLYGRDTRAVIMSRAESLDIDDAFDLEVAELLEARAAGRGLA
jgi:CMP-N,N'-diacetyllegionaminic acid synthase